MESKSSINTSSNSTVGGLSSSEIPNSNGTGKDKLGCSINKGISPETSKNPIPKHLSLFFISYNRSKWSSRLSVNISSRINIS